MTRIALVAPIVETVPPAGYGGIEQVVHLLDHDLTARGHDVLLLASAGSRAAGRFAPLTSEPSAARDERDLATRKEEAMRRASTVIRDERVDVILNHSWRLLDHLDGAVEQTLTTIHYPLDADPYRAIFRARSHGRFISISRSQQSALPRLRFVANIYNGIDVVALPFRAVPDNYLAYLGRAAPEKGLDIAIRAAQAAGIPLKVAAKVDARWRPWFDEVVAPLVRRGGVEMIGEIPSRDKGPFLAGAVALLHPSRWSEPFGLAAVEAMACGTPVVALRRGAADEVVISGETGFVASGEADVVAAVGRVDELDRAACRRHVERRFGRARMTDAYERLVERTVGL